MNRRFPNWAFVGLMIAVLSGAEPETADAQDQQPPPRQGPTMRVACSKDMQSLCPGLVGKDAAKCLREHRAQLSAECIAFFKEAKERRSATQSGAAPPAPSSPGGAETAGAQGGQPPPRQGPTMRVACSKDMQSLCPGLVGKDARKCLREHRAQLSAECTAFFKEAQARRNATPSGASPLGPSSPGEPETAGAQGGQSPPRQGPTMRVACSKDMQSLCAGVLGKDARQCLKEHRAQLSAECTAFFKEAQARRSATPSGASPPGGPTNGPDAGKK